jgi:IS5 family transposase
MFFAGLSGYKAQVVDNDDGIVLDHTVERGNPADAPQLIPAVSRVITRTRRRPRTVTADRGYGEAGVEDDLHELGIRTVVIPRKGRPSKARQTHEHRRWYWGGSSLRRPVLQLVDPPAHPRQTADLMRRIRGRPTHGHHR